MMELLEKCVRFPWNVVPELQKPGADQMLAEINVVFWRKTWDSFLFSGRSPEM